MHEVTLPNPFIARLSCATDLSAQDCALLEAVCAHPRRVAAGERLIDEGDRPEKVNLILDGFACRAKTLSDGKRQIMALLVPGDFCDLHVAILGEMDHAIRTLTPCLLVQMSRETILGMLDSSPAMTRALWWATLVDGSVVREWLVGMGRRSAEQQMAHLFCELLVRLRLVGFTQGDSYAFPLTQEELADVLGLSIVHVNRVLQRLRADKLVEWRERRVSVPDFERLSVFAGFNPDYLHMKPRTAAPAEARPAASRAPDSRV